MSRTGTITTHESGVDLVVEWQIPRFSTLRKTDGAWYFSRTFSFGGETWRLKIFPNGRSEEDSSGHVDLRLSKYHSGRSIRLSFSLSLKTAKKERHKEEHVTKDFQNFPENYHELLRFISRPELTALRSDLLPDDVLTVVCTMKGSPSAGSESHSASAEICAPVPDSAGRSSDSGECRHCKGNFAAGILSSHERKCMQRPVKCPDCLEVVVLQKWFDEHQCQHERPEDSDTDLCLKDADSSLSDANGEACASGSPICPHDDELNHDFKELFLSKEDCDVIVRVRDSEFPAHRASLKARSPVFASTFRHDMKENATGIVEIEDCDPSSFSDFLCYLYCGDATLISQENVFGLFTAADKYQVSNLRAKCLEFVKQNLSVDNFCETFTLALRHSEAELIRLCTDYFKQNVPKIIVTVKWQIFLAENPTEGNELFVKSFVPSSS